MSGDVRAQRRSGYPSQVIEFDGSNAASLNSVLSFHTPLPENAKLITPDDEKALLKWRKMLGDFTIEIVAFYYSYHFTDKIWGVFYNQDALRNIALDLMEWSTKDPLLQLIIDNPSLTAKEIAAKFIHPGAAQARVNQQLIALEKAKKIQRVKQNGINHHYAIAGVMADTPPQDWIGPTEAARLAYELVRAHELYHFETDCHATLCELATGRPLYLNYFRNIYKCCRPGLDCVEESLANKRKVNQAPDMVKAFARNWANQCPGAYANWHVSENDLLLKLESQIIGAWPSQAYVGRGRLLPGNVNFVFACPEYMVIPIPNLSLSTSNSPVYRSPWFK